ncbi:MAG TPA: transcription elongation factor GreA [Clostridia bacterium]|nr:transcription elongation factor GreA [Clostridia bacterium]
MKEANNSNENVMTAEGLAKLEAKLEHLKTVKRQEVSQRIKQALEFGDITENSEYDEAKNEQAFIEGEIMALENKLRKAKVVDGNVSTSEVNIGSKVTLMDVETNEVFEFRLLGSAEADPLNGSISNVSPVGNAILGRKKGETVSVSAPAGIVRYKIVSISK